MKITRGRLIPRPDGKRIEEIVGVVRTGTRSVSIAKMLAPPRWSEPAQKPKFDEVVLVARGTLTLAFDRKLERVRSGEAGLVPRDTRVIYRNDEDHPCEYVSVCAPAFQPHLARMEAAARGHSTNWLTVHARAKGRRRYATLIADSARRYLELLKVGGSEVTITLVGDAEIRRLNRLWRKIDRSTDVLSFSAGAMPRGTPGPRQLGDVVVSVDTAAREAKQLGIPVSNELQRYVAHGLLHLLGYDHVKPTQARRMARLERMLLNGPGMLQGSDIGISKRMRVKRAH